MNVNTTMFKELPLVFRESALIEGWNIPRMRENLRAEGWALNTEYFSEVMHALRNDILYANVVDELILVSGKSDTRDTKAIKRLATSWLKLLFPHAVKPEDVNKEEFERYCLNIARQMRGIIRKQLHLMDSEYSDTLPEMTIAGK